jgi:hypothetical protein
MSSRPTFVELEPAYRVAAVEEIRRPLWAGLVDAGHVTEHPLSEASLDWLKRMRRALVTDGWQDEFMRLDERCDRYLKTLSDEEEATWRLIFTLFLRIAQRMPPEATSADAFLEDVEEHGWDWCSQ